MKVEIKNTNHFIRSHQYSVNAFMVAYWLALLHSIMPNWQSNTCIQKLTNYTMSKSNARVSLVAAVVCVLSNKLHVICCHSFNFSFLFRFSTNYCKNIELIGLNDKTSKAKYFYFIRMGVCELRVSLFFAVGLRMFFFCFLRQALDMHVD